MDYSLDEVLIENGYVFVEENKAKDNEVSLVSLPLTDRTGKYSSGESWKIMYNNQRAGIVFIKEIDEKPIGKHASIQIYLNKPSQSKGIGSIAYSKAVKASKYKEIYAHMRKSNIASKRAAENAGFVDATPSDYRQLIMKFKK